LQLIVLPFTLNLLTKVEMTERAKRTDDGANKNQHLAYCLERVKAHFVSGLTGRRLSRKRGASVLAQAIVGSSRVMGRASGPARSAAEPPPRWADAGGRRPRASAHQ